MSNISINTRAVLGQASRSVKTDVDPDISFSGQVQMLNLENIGQIVITQSGSFTLTFFASKA